VHSAQTNERQGICGISVTVGEVSLTNDTGLRCLAMIPNTPEQAVEIVDRAFNAGDIETILNFYEENAVVVTELGKTARGKDELRSFFEQVLASKQKARQIKTYVLESDGIALFLSRWTLVGPDSVSDSQTGRFIATTVFRKQPSGEWKAVIDNSFGPLVLGPE
jgi:uncharacterized protein (TIGR02246 family)